MIFTDESVLKSLEDTLSKDNILTIDSKNRLFPIESLILAYKILENSKKERPIKIIISSDERNSNKTISCIALAFTQLYFKHDFSIAYFVDNKNLAYQIAEELIRDLYTIQGLTKGKETICYDDETITVSILENNSKIDIKILDNLPELKLKDLSYNMIIVDDAHKISKNFYEILQKNKYDFIILSVTKSLIEYNTFINKLFYNA